MVDTRVIAKPATGTVKVYRDGVEATSGWSTDITTAIVSFATAPAAGVQVTADFAFDVAVRFDSDQMDVTIQTYQLGTWGQIPVVEIRP